MAPKMRMTLATHSKMSPIQFVFDIPRKKKTLYLDKDGVVNDVVIRGTELSSPRTEKEIILSKELFLIRDFSRSQNYNIVIISNQPEITRNLIDTEFLRKYMLLVRETLPINVAIFCPHLKEME